MSRRHRSRAPLVALALLVTGCTGPMLANPVPSLPVLPTPTASPARPVDPRPVVLPRDDGPHDRLTEWWYDTGHLVAEDGRSFGFELVVFRAERGSFPVAWASHLAITDESGGRFLYDQRAQVGAAVDRVPEEGFDLAITGDVTPGVPDPAAVPWTMRGAGGTDRLDAVGVAADGTRFGLALTVAGGDRPVLLHDHDGYVDFGPAGGSYYYSRTRMPTHGTITLGDEVLPVTGQTWFDHQWGDFIAVGAGGWDWFAIGLDDGTDLTLSLVRDAEGGYPLAYGTLATPDGDVRRIPTEAFGVEVLDHWTSAATGATYPARWRITLPDEGLVIELTPTVADQELDTRSTTGVIYWEGSQHVRATRDGVALGGTAYVELTGYAPCC
ncbi:MAG: hypothetical protein KF809_01210 [Chloroflexi bacterium]|nr:hypothetical protein [Chloroflexota bacterium]